MKHHRISTAMLAVSLLGRLGLSSALADNEPKVLKGLSAPGSPAAPWVTPDLSSISEPLQERAPSEVDSNKAYELAELVDLAQRLNPETRLAWSHAKEAGAAVGLAKSEYYPLLALSSVAISTKSKVLEATTRTSWAGGKSV